MTVMARDAGSNAAIDEAKALDAVQLSLRAALAAAPWPPALHAVASGVLSDATRVLGGRVTPWVVLPLCCCAASCGNWRRAVPVATAAELFMTALDLCDDIEDGDHSGEIARYGMPVTLNLATALLALAHDAVRPGTSLDGADLPPDAPRRAQDALWQGLAEATGGQHLDLTMAGAAALPLESCLDIAGRKSGALVEACCRAGAAFGTADVALVDQFGALGRRLGLVAQLDNDMHDAAQSGVKSDLARRKQTVPVAVARAAGEPETLHDAVWQGGVQMAYALMHAERARAEDALESVVAACPDPTHARAALTPLLRSRGGEPENRPL